MIKFFSEGLNIKSRILSKCEIEKSESQEINLEKVFTKRKYVKMNFTK